MRESEKMKSKNRLKGSEDEDDLALVKEFERGKNKWRRESHFSQGLD